LGALSLCVFFLDALLVESGISRSVDTHLELTTHHDLGTNWKTIMVTASTLGGGAGQTVFAVLTAVLFLARRLAWAAVVVAAAIAGGAGLETALKLLFHRHRPHLWDGALQLHSYSFPSGHATGVMAAAAAIAYTAVRMGKRWVAVSALVLLSLGVLVVGASRIYLGVHWPTDVLGGYALGLSWTCVVVLALETGMRRLVASED
jgi:undecaprenyl-diphosphatase